MTPVGDAEFPQSPAFKLHALVQMMDRRAGQILQAEQGISYRQFLVLMMVAHMGESSQRTVADCLGVTAAAISRQIEALCDEGWLKRNPNPESRREHVLSLTPSGKTKVLKAKSLLASRFDALMEQYSAAEIETFNHVLDGLTQTLQQRVESGEAARD